MNDDPKQEMGELIDSEPELYVADADDSDQSLFGKRDDLSSADEMRDEEKWNELFNTENDRSLEASPERQTRINSRKQRDPKINNSFTGPYPIDPTDFNHNDKGANAQFLHHLVDNAKSQLKNAGKQWERNII